MVTYRVLVLTREALHLFLMKDYSVQEETQGLVRCKVADEPVVVLKSQPEKLGNNVEEKTEMTAN